MHMRDIKINIRPQAAKEYQPIKEQILALKPK